MSAPNTLKSSTAVSPDVIQRSSVYSGAPSLHPSIAQTTEYDYSIKSPNDSAVNTLTFNSPDLTREKVHRSISIPSTVRGKDQDITDTINSIERLEDPRLAPQSFQPSQVKLDELEKNALLARVAKGLERRMSNQDAILRPKQMNEKRMLLAL